MNYPNINIRQPLFEQELKDLLRYRIDYGYILVGDYLLSRQDLLEGYKMFLIDYLSTSDNPARTLRELKWQNYL